MGINQELTSESYKKEHSLFAFISVVRFDSKYERKKFVYLTNKKQTYLHWRAVKIFSAIDTPLLAIMK